MTPPTLRHIMILLAVIADYISPTGWTVYLMVITIFVRDIVSALDGKEKP